MSASHIPAGSAAVVLAGALALGTVTEEPAEAATETPARATTTVAVAMVASSQADAAVAWAEQRLGTTEYQDNCGTFVHDAWSVGAGVEIGGGESADDWARKNQGLLSTDGTPPRGATVWWWATEDNPWGHAAISLGDGTAISTNERQFTDVHVMDIAERNATRPYAGWYLPA
jgi:hypothetical protein